jgi:putative DNA primase/helicase
MGNLSEFNISAAMPVFQPKIVDAPEIQFMNAMRNAGLEPPMSIIPDGAIYRFNSNGKAGNKNGWYIYHGDNIAAGSFGDWQKDISQTWRADIGRTLTPKENAEHNARIAAMKAQREADDINTKAEAKQRANNIWNKAAPALSHDYLTNKGIKAYGIKINQGALVIPLHANDGDIHSLQFINADGSKMFLSGGRIKGCYFIIGEPQDIIYICEGYATGASIHEATGGAVVVAFNAGNLKAVAQFIRAKYPAIKLVLCADDDTSKVGITKANEAARLVSASVVLPDFSNGRTDKTTDFNDLHQLRGLAEVKRQLDAQNAPVTDYLDAGDANTLAHEYHATVSLQCAADIKPEPIRWLWDGWLAKGKLHIFAGTAGTGKTTISIALAATITTGGRFPDGSPCPTGSVLIWSGEDSPADTLIPRLMAASADLNKVHFIGDTLTAEYESRSFDPAIDMQALERKAATIPDLALLIIDPIVNAVAGDSHKNGEVRRALQPVVDFGERLNCAVLGITHFSKGGQGKDPLERVTGSLAFGALARIVLATAKIDDGDNSRRIFCRAKSNIGIDSGGFEYDLQQKEVQAGIFSSYTLWGEAIEGSARDLLAEPDNRESGENGNSALAEAKDFLQSLLADGELSQKQIKDDARGASHSWRTVERAKKELNIRSSKSVLDGCWYWKLTTNSAKNDQDRQGSHINNVAVLADLPQKKHFDDVMRF